MPAYWQQGREIPKSIHVCRAGVTTWTLKKAAKGQESSRQRPVTQCQPLAPESEKEDGKNVLTLVYVPA